MYAGDIVLVSPSATKPNDQTFRKVLWRVLKYTDVAFVLLKNVDLLVHGFMDLDMHFVPVFK